MLKRLHILTAFISIVSIIIFQLSTIISELFASASYVACVKGLIVTPGLFILIPALIITGITGTVMSNKAKGRLVNNKKRRMPLIAMNGIIILIPSAVFLNMKASAGELDILFYTIQIIEIAAGLLNLTLMLKNARDGRRLAGKYNV
ncbi:MAG: hypothetical protein AB7E76_04310 [Deferribacterales bacterium]